MSGITTLMGSAAARRKKESNRKIESQPEYDNNEDGCGYLLVVIFIFIIAISHFVFHLV